MLTLKKSFRTFKIPPLKIQDKDLKQNFTKSKAAEVSLSETIFSRNSVVRYLTPLELSHSERAISPEP